MRILFISDNFPPEINAPANRTYEHCKEWAKLGAEVTVITCFPNFPKGEVFPGFKNNWKKEEIIDGIKVIRVWSFITANEGTVRRILDYISFGVTSFFHGLFIKSDIVIGTSPQFFSAMSAWQIGFFTRRKWVIEVRDLWPESILAVGAMKRNFLIKFFEGVEATLYKSADHIIVVTDSFKDQISARGINKNKISVHKNGANLELFKPTEKPKDLINKHKLQNKFVIAYIGTHGLAHGLHFILDAIGEIQNSYPDFVFLFIGEGAEKKKITQRANELNLKNTIFLDSVSKTEVVRYLSLMDVALVNLKKSNTFLNVIPSKIFEAAAMEKPILLGLDGEAKKIIENYNAGLCFIPEDKDSFHEKLIDLYNQKDQYFVYCKGCQKLAKDFDRKKIAYEMLNTLKSV
jgi:hypothetical protein